LIQAGKSEFRRSHEYDAHRGSHFECCHDGV
jgi:hypothetical protein